MELSHSLGVSPRRGGHAGQRLPDREGFVPQGCCGNASCEALNDDPLIGCDPGGAGDSYCASVPDGDQFPRCCDVGGCPV